VGTDKRARQKANRALKNEQMAKQAHKDQLKRRGLRYGLAAVGGLGFLLLVAWLFGAFDGDDEGDLATTDPFATTVTTAPGGTTASTDAAATTGTTETTVAAVAVEPTCPAEDGSSAQARAFTAAPPTCIDESATYTALVSTNKGDVTIELDAASAPQAVNNFVFLARYHYFDDTPCHRIIPGFVVQCGDPTGTGTGGPGYAIPDELPAEGEYQIGSVAMANSGPDTAGSQFFVITGDQGAALPASYTLFGTVTEGLDDTVPALDAAGNPDPSANGVPPLEPVTIQSVTITQS
jgi:cyclophilin family peptidyl-prolyl cis-trans isomerase